ncbi:O-methyltransferase [Microcystis aeruginosa]|uniref:O-methyltransferase n=1 Tax=Microcystis aeruginosa TaxID=1126 RepID=UPI0007762ECF|nr:class I SAM-dependent methyltransferase [Microcystis aeruginosa]KXS89470.1 hypothetical protein OA58_21175 [Microcystis aeruginosa NIES-88]BCU11907.1 hypothetical protein MAN88_24710 [Microcystis aeruginosa]
MKFEEISKIVKGIPYITVRNARYLYDLIISEKIENILELGIAHGTATCYMAAALDELGAGKISSIDLLERKSEYQPSPEEQLTKANLEKYVQITRMQTGYTWFLHDEIKRLTTANYCQPKYDLCIIDGPKNWTIDGCAFFLVDKLLKENGWIIFDDYSWTYAAADKRREETDGISHRKLSEAERNTPHIKEIFELLVMQHPNYSDFFVHPVDGWAIARKKQRKSDHKTYTIVYKETYKDFITAVKYRIKKLLKG